MSRAYSSMVRSEEKKPLPAVDMMDMRVHLALFLYVSSTRSCTPAHSTLKSCLVAPKHPHTYSALPVQLRFCPDSQGALI